MEKFFKLKEQDLTIGNKIMADATTFDHGVCSHRSAFVSYRLRCE